MGDAPEQKMSTEYIVGLNHWLHANRAAAQRHLDAACRLIWGKSPAAGTLHRNGAREDLARLNDSELQNIE